MDDLYIGKTLQDSKPLLYSSRDLVTHGVCVGMTGSGKTGLCIGLLEELLLTDVPLFLLDPKGDVTNLLLVFPDLEPGDFTPWVDPESARRNGRSVEEEAAVQAKLWREGLVKWNVPLDTLRSLREKVAYRVFTPGSRAAEPVNLLGSFEPPAGLSWERDEEALRGRGAGTGHRASDARGNRRGPRPGPAPHLARMRSRDAVARGEASRPRRIGRPLREPAFRAGRGDGPRSAPAAAGAAGARARRE